MLEDAVSLHQKGELAKAARLYREVLAREPQNANALHFLGVLEGQRKNLSAAIHLIDQAIAIDPNNLTFLFNRIETLLKLKRFNDALANYDRILAIKPDSAEALFKRGNLLQRLKRFDAAIASYDRALAIRPNYAGALNNRGNALQDLKRFDEALASFDRALAIKPDYAGALYNRGNVLLELARHGEALASYDQALTIRPDYAAALDQRGCALLELHRLEDARRSFERALAIRPDPVYHSNLVFALNFDPEATAALQQAERARWNKLHAQKFAGTIPQHTNDPNPNRRLRIGYVSSSFSHQAATFAFGGVILHHDPRQFDVVCYSDTIKQDDVTARLRACVHKWHDTAALSDQELARLIEDDGIDILVDCVGHMRDHRLLVFARKPAPIQVTAWGEPTGTGLPTMDYLFADPVLIPKSERSLLVERVYDLPNFLGYWTLDTLPEPAVLPALANGYVTFGSFNRFAKIQDPVLHSWAAILRAVHKSRLVLKLNQLHFDPNPLKNILGEAGIESERVTLLGRSDRAHYFSAYQGVDIALDSFPHGGGMTTLDALWMGVPVVTFTGRTISSRLAAASLTALGLTDFIASDVEAYVRLAVAKAGDLDALSRLRASLRGRVANSAIGHGMRYARAVETAYRKMWRTWCKKGPRRNDNTRSPPVLEEAASLHPKGEFAIAEVRDKDVLALPANTLAAETRNSSALEEALAIHQRGELAEAEARYRAVLARDPQDANALHFLGVLAGQRKNLTTAIELIERSIALEPDNTIFLSNHAQALYNSKRFDDALVIYDRILAINPDSAEAHYKKASILQYLKRFADALLSCDRALAIKQGYIEAFHKRGTTLLLLDRPEEALESYDAALAINPEYAQSLGGRGNTLMTLQRVAEAKPSYERALAIAPNPVSHSNLIFALNFDPGASAARQQAERSRWNELYAEALAPRDLHHKNAPDPDRRLRVGYVSSNFRYQAAAYAFGGVILHHDPSRYDVVCYSDTVKEDDVTSRLRSSVHKWHSTAGLSDDELTELIRVDGIDILVDCTGHMKDHRLCVFARKPAPIQVTAWGEPTGTGLKTMDYLFADPVLVPMNERSLLAERVYDLPNFLGYWTPDPLPEPTALPALAKGYVTFGSFNRFMKLQDPVLHSWAAILRAVPKSRLVLKLAQVSMDAARLKRFEKIFDEERIGFDRVTLLGGTDRSQHFSAYQDVDIALDPFPHGGGMTTLDALWMGVPVVTFPGQTISSRLAAASLTALGLTDFIASDVETYIRLAVAKAGKLDALSRLRSTLRQRVANSPIGDAPRYASSVEAAYREMWRRWCVKQQPVT